MKSQLILFGLALSLVFNIFCLAGYMRSRSRPAREAVDTDVTKLVAHELGLDSGQSELFARLHSQGREDAEVYQDGVALLRAQMLDELDGDQQGVERLHEIVEEESELRRDWRHSAANHFRDFVESLTPQQRQRLRTRISRADKQRTRHEAMLRRFDADGDGRLDAQERMTAREHMQQRRKEREQRWDPTGRDRPAGNRPDRGNRMREQRMRREIMMLFDADGNGRLDPQERKAFQEWMRTAPRNDQP
jgi:Ca2+-binding EF-hand superfamily protein